MGKTNALCGKITSSQQQHDESIPEAWECFQDYTLECPPSWNGELATDADVLSLARQ